MLLAHGAFAPVCLALPIIDVFGSMPRASGVGIGVAISFGWCAYFLPVALLAFVHLRSAPFIHLKPDMSEAGGQHPRRLPGAVHDLAIRLGVKPKDDPSHVRLAQTGRMKRNLASDTWMPFTATQTISTHACEFDWRARAGPFGLISGRDALAGGEGRFDIIALGFIPIARAPHTPALVRGELMRYLAEIAWAPHAILHNRALRWRVIDAETLSVGAGTGETACQVLLSLDSDGRIAGAFAPDRPRATTAPILPTPWRGRFSDYRLHGDISLPFAGEVAWDIEGREVVYWQGRIQQWEAPSAGAPSGAMR